MLFLFGWGGVAALILFILPTVISPFSSAMSGCGQLDRGQTQRGQLQRMGNRNEINCNAWAITT